MIPDLTKQEEMALDCIVHAQLQDWMQAKQAVDTYLDELDDE